MAGRHVHHGAFGQALIRVHLDGDKATKGDQWPMERLREVEQGPDGDIYLLEDGDGRLLKLSPKA
ncbi:hypothetical protein MMA231_02641 [Asticcacaulis sp. MM231]|uniref:PQQ-dependent sugar dehydrogenase n=1 Tax=Asticcacaulis sp. MM231 TaxID=3157666 RepID=UPI0032D59E44